MILIDDANDARCRVAENLIKRDNKISYKSFFKKIVSAAMLFAIVFFVIYVETKC